MDTKTSTRARSPRKKLGLAALLIGVAALAGCAEIETELTVDQDLSGSRVMIARISESDMESNVKGTASDINAVVEANLPSALTFVPFTSNGDGYEAVFTLTFSDPEDYVEKAQELLNAGSVDIVAEVIMERSDSPFATGVLIEENFSSLDLLTWVEDPIIAAGIAEESGRSDILNDYGNSVFVDGEEHSLWSGSIYLDTLGESGFSSIYMETTYDEAVGAWDRTFHFRMYEDDYEKLSGAVDQYFSENLPTGAVLVETTDPSDYELSWDVTVTGLEASEVAAVTDQMLMTTGSEFAFTEGVGFDSEITALEGVLVDTTSCSSVCAWSDDYIVDFVTPPEGWFEAYDGGGVSDQVPFSVYTDETEPVRMIRFLDLDSIEVSLAFGLGGSTAFEVIYALPATEAEPNKELLASVFSVSDDEGVVVTEGSDVWKFKVSMEEDNSIMLSSAVEAYLPGSSLDLYETQSFFTRAVYGTMLIDFGSVISGSDVANGISYSVSPSFMGKFMGDSQYHDTVTVPASDSRPVSFAATMPTVGSFIFWGVLALVVIVGAVLLLVFRKKIAAANAARRQKTLAQAAAVGAGAAAATQVPEQNWEGDFGEVPEPVVPQETAFVAETAKTTIQEPVSAPSEGPSPQEMFSPDSLWDETLAEEIEIQEEAELPGVAVPPPPPPTAPVPPPPTAPVPPPLPPAQAPSALPVTYEEDDSEGELF